MGEGADVRVLVIQWACVFVDAVREEDSLVANFRLVFCFPLLPAVCFGISKRMRVHADFQAAASSASWNLCTNKASGRRRNISSLRLTWRLSTNTEIKYVSSCTLIVKLQRRSVLHHCPRAGRLRNTRRGVNWTSLRRFRIERSTRNAADPRVVYGQSTRKIRLLWACRSYRYCTRDDQVLGWEFLFAWMWVR